MLDLKPHRPTETHPVLIWLVVLTSLYILVRMVHGVPTLGAEGVLIDFDAFYIASQMVLEGDLAGAYDVDTMLARQAAAAGRDIFMPWTYPPQFNMLIAPLSLVERSVAYGVFTGLSLFAYLWVIRRLAKEWTPGVLLALMPGLWVAVLVGQSGLLLATLMGLCAGLWAEGRRKAAGVPLGLMIIKPHLALGLGFLVLWRREWRMLLITALVILLSVVLASWAFGWPIWNAFRGATEAAGQNLKDGRYPLFRMTSVYALSYSFGASPSLAFGLHLLGALVAMGAVIAAAQAGWPMRRVLGVTVLASLAFSPYNYDYDMPVLGVALALLASDLAARASGREKLAIWVGASVAGGAGMLISLGLEQPKGYSPYHFKAWGTLGYLGVVGVVARVLTRRCAPVA